MNRDEAIRVRSLCESVDQACSAVVLVNAAADAARVIDDLLAEHDEVRARAEAAEALLRRIRNEWRVAFPPPKAWLDAITDLIGKAPPAHTCDWPRYPCSEMCAEHMKGALTHAEKRAMLDDLRSRDGKTVSSRDICGQKPGDA